VKNVYKRKQFFIKERNIMTKVFFIVVAFALLGVGCNESQVAQTVPDNSAALSVIINGTEYLTAEQVHQYYQQPGASGLVRLMRIEKNICGWKSDGTFGPFDYDDSHHTDAIFWNSAGKQVSIGDHFELNERPIKQYADGTAYTNLGGNYIAPVYFSGSMNRLEFMSNSLFDGFRDSVSFGTPIHMTNVHRLDTINTNQDLVLNWVGGSVQGKIKVLIEASRLVDGYVNKGETIGVQYYIEPKSDRTLTIPKQILMALDTKYAIGKYYDISLTTAEPKTMTAPNNKTIGVLGVSQHKVTVVLNHP
jgi:hypothetical protein